MIEEDWDDSESGIAHWLGQLTQGDRRTLARSLSRAESQLPAHRSWLDRLWQLAPAREPALRIGITGAPGAGKSTLIDSLGAQFLEQGRSLAVLTIDPSSPVSGGSLLADKTRMLRLATHPRAYVRPSAAGSALGGLAESTEESVRLTELAGFDVVLIETVGVGQSEVEVTDIADYSVLVLSPSAGDELQALKRGITEAVDYVVVNKADGSNRAAALELAQKYASSMSLLRPADNVTVRAVSAVTGEGITELQLDLMSRCEQDKEAGRLQAARRLRWARQLKRAASQRLLARAWRQPGVAARYAKLKRAVDEGHLSLNEALLALRKDPLYAEEPGEGRQAAPKEWDALLQRTLDAALKYRAALASRPIRATDDVETCMQRIDPLRTLPATGKPAIAVLDELVGATENGITAMSSPRFYGWVIGGTHPAAVAAEWMCSVWDQNAGMGPGVPAATAVELVALRWLAAAVALPSDVVGTLVTGATMANFTALAAARQHVLDSVGWDVGQRGLSGAPPVTILVGHERHDSIDKVVRLLGFGKAAMSFVAIDAQGRMQPEALQRALRGPGLFIVCTQAGNVNSGSFDPFEDIAQVINKRRAEPDGPAIWWHIDGAFGIWARACPALAHLAAGAELADSWATDAHKFLNTPYDCGVVFTRHPIAHRRAMAIQGAYLSSGEDTPRLLPGALAPELSRRARGFAVWSALRAFGADGLSELVLSRHQLAQLLAQQLTQIEGVQVLNEVVFNQVVVAFFAINDAGANERTRRLCVAIQTQGVCYPTPTIWRGQAAIRFSVSNAETTEHDVRRSVAAVAEVYSAALVAGE